MPRKNLILLIFFLLYAFWSRASAQEEPDEPVRVLSPEPGQALQGSVPILAQIEVEDLEAVELTFSYASDSTRTWFYLARVEVPLLGEKLIDWDTTTLTDGNYILKVEALQMGARRENGRQVMTTVEGLRIRNYSPVETPTLTPSPTPAPQDTPVPTLTLTPTTTPVPPTGTPLPTNPAQVLPEDVSNNLGRGAVGAVAFFALMGLYGSVRRLTRR